MVPGTGVVVPGRGCGYCTGYLAVLYLACCTVPGLAVLYLAITVPGLAILYLVAWQSWRLPQSGKQCSKRLSISGSLRNFDEFNRPSRPKVLATYTRMTKILSS